MTPLLFWINLAAVLLSPPTPWQHPDPAASAPSSTKLLTPSDYGKWESLGRDPHAMSSDGQWLAFPVKRVNGENELRVRSLEGEAVSVHPFGTNPRFSADSKHLLFTTGLSEEERKQRESEGEPIQEGVAVRNLDRGEVREFEGIREASFDESGRYLALHAVAEEDGKGKPANLTVLDLAGDELTFGNVTEYAWSETGSALAFIVQPENDVGNGIHLYELASRRLLTLDSSRSEYEGLAWCEEAAHLAVYRWRASEDEAKEDGQGKGDEEGGSDRDLVVLAWEGAGADSSTSWVLEEESKGIPAGMEIVRSKELRWSKSGTKLSFGLREIEPEKEAEDGADDQEELPGVQIWHPNDVRIFPEQKLEQEEDRERALTAVWDLDRNRVIPVGTDRFGRVTVLEDWRFAIEELKGPYPWGTMFGRPFHDVWSVNLEDGTRTKILERVRYSWPSAAGRHLLSFDGQDYQCIRLEDGAKANLTEGLETSFAEEEYDTPTDMLPPHGVGGWLDDDQAVLLYDRHDVWQIAPDGSAAKRLTRGAEQEIQHRVEDLDEEEEAFNEEQPLYFWTWSERSEKRGYARLLPDAEVPESLFFVDKMPGRLTKAEETDVFVFSLQAVDDSPDYFVTGNDFSAARQLTELNPFQSDYAWTRSELLDFDSEAGVPLQAALYYPANHDPTRRYPMIVWTYEKETPWVHIYDVPDEHDYYNFTTWTQRGYFVLLMDIAYRPRDPGVCAIEAVRPAIGAVVQRGLVDADRVGLVGHSWGGYQAAYLPTRTKLFAASVAGAPLTDFVSFMGQIHWRSGLAEPEHWETGQGRMEVPFWEDPDAYRRNSPLHGVHDLETPILLAHGDDDGVVEFFQSTVFYNYARRAGKQVVLLVYEGEGHGFRKKPNQLDYHRRILEWFDHYLKGVPAPDWIAAGTQVIALEEEKRRVAQVDVSSTDLALNHFYAVLDEETFAAIRDSSFLSQEFAKVDTGLPDFLPVTEASNSIYIRGKNTYLEFFGPDNRFQEPVGQVGIGLGVDVPSQLEEIAEEWNRSLGGEVIRQQQSWTAEDPPIPWHDVLLHPDTLASPSLVLWASAYRSEFLPWLYPERSAKENGVARADFLAPHFDPERLLEDITGLTLALPEPLRDKIARQLEAAGYERVGSEGGLKLQGRDWNLSLVEETESRRGLVAVEFSTTREKEGVEVVPVGLSSVLVFGRGPRATWAFLSSD